MRIIDQEIQVRIDIRKSDSLVQSKEIPRRAQQNSLNFFKQGEDKGTNQFKEKYVALLILLPQSKFSRVEEI